MRRLFLPIALFFALGMNQLLMGGVTAGPILARDLTTASGTPIAAQVVMSASQAAVIAVYSQATCVLLPNDTKWKVFIMPGDRAPLGYGPTSDAAWADAATKLPASH